MIDAPAAKIVKRARQRATFWARFVSSAYADHQLGGPPRDVDHSQIRAFCLFVGYPRSGSTLVASLLNAHPDILLGHELDALGFVRWGASRRQLFHAISSSADAFSQSGHQWEGYDYKIETPWTNGNRELRVIGDKEASWTSVRLARDATLLAQLEDTVRVPVKVVHVVRNPFDNVATMYLRGRYPILRLPLSQCIADFAVMTRATEALKRRIAPANLLELTHEDVLRDPVGALAELCAFLGVDAEPEYVQAATSIVNPDAKSSRDRLLWTSPDVRAVEELIAASSAHRRYAGTRPSRIRETAEKRRSRPRHRPNFLVIGAQRCGTTLMHRLLERHPEIYVPRDRKEIHFFDDHYARGVGWYEKFFPVDAGGLTAIGEVSPSYMTRRIVAERIHAFDPGMRLIVLLRNPVERLWSAYNHLRRVHGERRSFSDFIRQDEDAVARGKYAEQLLRYTDVFPMEQLLVVGFEDLLRNPDAELQRVRDFLRLREPWDGDTIEVITRENANFEVRYATLYRGARALGQVLTDRLGQPRIVSRFKQSRAMSVFQAGEIGERMSAADRAYLTEYYAPDVSRLREELGIHAARAWRIEPLDA